MSEPPLLPKPDQDEYDQSYASLARAYSDDEPEYTDADLIWKNPNYVPPKELPKA